jgi:macrolide-specific efflux system membrane fusion protein
MTFFGRKFLRWLPWLLLVLGAAAYWAIHTDPAPGINYVTGTLSRGTLEDSITATGVLEASQYVDIGAQVSGILKKIEIQIGQSVRKGQLLAEIDPTLFEAAVTQNEATLKDLEAQRTSANVTLKLASERYERNQNLLRSDAVSLDDADSSQAERDKANSSVDAIMAQIEKARGSLDAAKANLGFTKIYAPIDGTVIQIQAREGQTLNASQTAPILFRLADLGTMTVKAQVSEADIQRIHAGMPVYFTVLGDPDTRHEGKVRGVEPSPTTTNPPIFYNTLFDVPNETRLLMPSMTAQVFFPVWSKTNVLMMPSAALDFSRFQDTVSAGSNVPGKHGGANSPGSSKVYVMREGKPEEIKVSLGASNRISTEVLSGLSDGDQVITGPMVRDSGKSGLKPAGKGLFAR